MSSYKFTQRAVASPDAPLKPLVRKRARSAGENWVRVTRQPDPRAKKPRTGGSQQPACDHAEHDNRWSLGNASEFRVGTGKEPQVAGLAKAEKICS